MTDRQKHLSRNVVIVAFVALASGFGQDLISPALPGFLLALGASHADIGLIDGLLNGATAIFRLVSGILSDNIRERKGLVFVGYVVSSLARPLLSLASSFPGVAILRIADGIGKGTKDAPRDALVAESSAGIRGKAFGFHRLIDTAGSVLGPLAASGILIALGTGISSYRLIFLLSALPGLVALALIIFGVHEPEHQGKKPASPKKQFPMVFWIFLFGSIVAMLTRANDAIVLLRASASGIPQAWIPAVFAGFTLLYAVVSYPIGVWSDRIGRLPFIVGGWAVLGLAEAAFAFSGSASILAGFVLYGLFYAMTEGSGRAFIADIIPFESRGTAYALFHASTGIALIIGGFAIGKIWDTASLATAFECAAVGSMVAALILLPLLGKKNKIS